MKRTFIGSLLAIFMLLIAPNAIEAASLKVTVSCNDTTVNKTTTCTVKGQASAGQISSFKAKYTINGASFSKFSNGADWQGEAYNSEISLYTGNNKSGSFTIGTFTIKTTSVGKATITLSNVYASDADFNDINGISNASASFNVTAVATKATTTKNTNKTTSKVTTTRNPNAITQPSTQPTTSMTTTSKVPLELTSVRVDDFNVSFDGGVYYATVKPETDKVTISATAGSGITIVGTGQRNLAVGDNAVDLVLRNQGGQTATFQLIVTRPEGAIISDTKLTSLRVVGYDFAFSPDTKEYTVTVPSSLNEVYVDAKSYSDDVIITGAGPQVLKKGTNEVYIRVSYGELGSTEYKITIKRSYMSVFMWIIIGTLGAALVAMGIYANINRKAAVSKAVAEKNKLLAQNNRAEMSSAPQVQLNGESVVGTGKKAVAPTPVKTVVATPQTPVAPVASAAPAPQAVQTVQTVQPAKPTVVAATPTPQAPASSEPQMIQTAPPAQVKVVKTTVVPVQQPATQTVNTGTQQPATVVSTNTNKPVV